MITKRFDDYRSETGPIGGHVLSHGYYRDGDGIVEKYEREGTVILEERIVSHERPWAWPLFMIISLLLLVVGILTLVFCIEDYYYSQIWTAILLFIFSIIGAVHRGIYRGSAGKWRNILYIVFGLITVIALNFCAAMILIRLNHVNIQLVEYGPDGFMDEELWRMDRHDLEPSVLLAQELETNVWACYALDWITIVLVCIAFGVLSSVLVICNNYYNSNHTYRREVDPFCKPSLFNPWGHALLGQAIIFVGMVVKTAAHGNYAVRWQDTWAAVWAGIFPVFAGMVAAFALKRVTLKYGLILIIIAAILEFLSFAVAGAMIGLYIWALTEIIPNFNSPTLAQTLFSNNLLTWSVIIFALAIAVMLVNVIYCIALFVRLLWEGCCREQQELRRERRRVYTEERHTEKYPRYAEREFVVERERDDYSDYGYRY